MASSGLHGPGFLFLGSCSVGVVGGVSSTISRSSSCSVAIVYVGAALSMLYYNGEYF